MKLNSLFLFLILITSIKSNNLLDSFSIETFKDYLKRNGLFEIIETIKKLYGQDVAIISCEELNKSYNGNCKKLVTDYMDEKTENINVGDHGLIADYKNSQNRDKESIASSQSEEGPSKSHYSIGQYFQPPKKLVKQLLNHRKIMKNSKMRKMRGTIKINYKRKELMPIKSKIIERVQKLPLFMLIEELSTFLDSLFKI